MKAVPTQQTLLTALANGAIGVSRSDTASLTATWGSLRWRTGDDSATLTELLAVVVNANPTTNALIAESLGAAVGVAVSEVHPVAADLITILNAEDGHALSEALATALGIARSEQNVIAGDTVQAGQSLCSLDSRQILLQKRALETQWNVLDKQKDEALAKDNVAGGRVIAAKQDEMLAQLDLVQWQLDHTEIRAPIDGVVLAGDLRKRVGSPVSPGDALFEIAPAHQVFLELAIPEEEIDEIEGRPAGLFATNAAPELTHEFHLATIRPAATIQSNRTVFVCEAELDQTREWFRSGMEGVARISVGSRPVWWVMLHNMIDYIRLKAWL